MIGTPQKGQKLYSYDSDGLSTYTFIREEFAPEATLMTWIVRDDARQETCSVPIDYYYESEVVAISQYLGEFFANRESLALQIAELQRVYDAQDATIAMLHKALADAWRG